MGALSTEELIRQSPRLGSLPDIVGELNAAVDDPQSSVADLADIISRDPALSARLLAIVNSPWYGLRGEVADIERAVSLAGTQQLRFLALSTVIVRQFTNLPNALVTMDTFWKHSFTCAVATRALAESSGERDLERHFLGGLLHDIGSLLIYTTLPSLAKEAILHARSQNQPIYQAEQLILGFDHAVAGGALLRHWGLPESLAAAVEGHHELGDPAHFGREKALVHLANGIANAIHPSNTLFRQPLNTDPAAWGLAGLDTDQLDATLASMDERVAEAMGVFYFAA